jgi:hypothetical protein
MQHCTRIICLTTCLLVIHIAVNAQTNAFNNGTYNPYAFQQTRETEKLNQFNESMSKANQPTYKPKEEKQMKAPKSTPSQDAIEEMCGTSKCISGNCENGYGVYEIRKITTQPWDISTYGNSTHYLEGHFKDEELDGIGKEVNYRGKLKYVGELKEGRYDGKGFHATYSFTDGSLESTYEGDFINGKYDGKGIYTLLSPTYGIEKYYSGGWKNDKKEGNGMRVDYFRGKMEGYYIGNWKDDKKDGYGVDSSSSSYLYIGNFVEGKREGQGKQYWDPHFTDGKGNVLEYDGEWIKDEMHGTGIEYDFTGKKIFEGMFYEGKRHGNGKEYAADGTVSAGVWKNGVKN